VLAKGKRKGRRTWQLIQIKRLTVHVGVVSELETLQVKLTVINNVEVVCRQNIFLFFGNCLKQGPVDAGLRCESSEHILAFYDSEE